MAQQFSVGQAITLPCAVTAGPFSDEPLVTIDTVQGPISGFIKSGEISEDANGNAFVKGIVRAVHGDTIDVWIQGSFLTTNGFAAVPRAGVAAA